MISYGKDTDTWEGQVNQGRAKILEYIAKTPSTVKNWWNEYQLGLNNNLIKSRDRVVKSMKGLDDDMTLGEARKLNEDLNDQLIYNDWIWTDNETVGDYRKRKQERLENVEDRAVTNFVEMTEAYADNMVFKNYENEASFWSLEGFMGTLAEGVNQAPHMIPSMAGGITMAAGVASSNPTLIYTGYAIR